MTNGKSASRFACVLLAATLLSSCCGREAHDFDFKYRDRAHAEAEGTISRGWIPENLPLSARNVLDTHYPESNEGCFNFDFDVKDQPEFLTQMTVIAFEQVPFPGFCLMKRPAWWPESLIRSNNQARRDYSFHSFREIEDMRIIVAIENGNPRAWCWRITD